LSLLLCAGALLAQTPAESPQPTTSSHPAASPQPSAGADQTPASPVRARHQPKQPPCWAEAGISPQMVNDRWKIEDQGKVKISAVCNDPSLSPAQRHDKIERIHAETDQAVARLIPSKQLQAFNSCQMERDKARPKPASQKELGPCGGVVGETTPGADAHTH